MYIYFDDDVLKLLGRLHSAEKAEQAAEDILSTGKQLNISTNLSSSL